MNGTSTLLMDPGGENMTVQYFTFGVGQELAGHVQPIMADSPEAAREKMFEVHGKKWAFQYSEDEFLKARKEGYARETVLKPIILKGGEQSERTSN